MKFFRTLSPAGFLVLALLGACVSACAASDGDSKGLLSNWDNLKSLTRGQEIRVQMNDDKYYRGEFGSLSNDGITIRDTAGEQTLARKDISRISHLIGQNHRRRNILIGAAIGACLGLAAGLTADHIISNSIGVRRAWAPIGATGVGLAGALIGRAVPTGGWRDIYRSP